MIPVMADGSKRPTTRWKELQSRIADEPTLTAWFSRTNGVGIGIVCGRVSGGLEVLDFEAGSPFESWKDCVVRQGAGELLAKLVIVDTPSGGSHLYYRADGVAGNQRLAFRRTTDSPTKVVIETRGEGGYVVAPGSPPACHPSGKLYYLRQGSLETIARITNEERELLLQTAKSFNEGALVAPSNSSRVVEANHKLRPGDIFNQQAEWRTILEPAGWSIAFERADVTYWRRPGKSFGCSATTNFKDSDRLHVFSTNAAPFRPETSYDKFTAYALLNHGGDFRKAARELARQGYHWGDSAPDLGFPLTDLGNAERLVQRFGNDLRFCTEWGKWLVWSGAHWEIDRLDSIYERAKQVARGIYEEAADSNDVDRRQALSKHAVRSENHQRIKAMVELACTSLAPNPEDFDADPWLLNCTNGTLDLRSGRLRPHRREDWLTKRAGSGYLPEAACPLWLAFLNTIMLGRQELILFLQTAVGYSLTGRTSERCVFILYGTGKNGKSTFLETLRSLLADYAQSITTEALLARHQDSGISNDIARLRGARFVPGSETDQGRRLAESKLKSLTGQDTISARFLHCEFFDFRPTFKLWLSTNHKPVITGTDDAIWDRIRLIPFDYRVPNEADDKGLADKLAAELPGILAWAVEGCLRWQRDGLEAPRPVQEATTEYRREMDLIAQFLDDRCLLNPAARVSAKTLHQAYSDWCSDNGEVAMSSRMLSRRLSDRGFRKAGRDSSGRFLWEGIGVIQATGSEAAEVTEVKNDFCLS